MILCVPFHSIFHWASVHNLNFNRVNLTEAQKEGYQKDIVAMIRLYLVDDESNVRAAAARTFVVLQEHLGATAVDQTLPTLLDALHSPGPSSMTALQALREVMAVSW